MATDAFIAKLEANDCGDKKKPCLTPTKNKEIFLEDGKSSALRVINDKQEEIYKVKMDGCFLRNPLKKSKHPSKPLKRCDWILYSKKHKKIFFIELKRLYDIPKCVKQFNSSIKIFDNDEAMPCCVLVSLVKKDIPRLQKEIKSHGLKFKTLVATPYSKPAATTTLNNLLNAPEFAN